MNKAPKQDETNKEMQRAHNKDVSEGQSLKLSAKKQKLSTSRCTNDKSGIVHSRTGDNDKVQQTQNLTSYENISSQAPTTIITRVNHVFKSSAPNQISQIMTNKSKGLFIDLTDDTLSIIPLNPASNQKIVNVFREVYMKGKESEINKLPASTAGRPDYLKKRWKKNKVKDHFDGKSIVYGNGLHFRSVLDIEQLFSPHEMPNKTITGSFSYLMQLVKNSLRPETRIAVTDVLKDPYALEIDGVFSHKDIIRFSELEIFNSCNLQTINRLIIPTEDAFWDFDFENQTASYYGSSKLNSQEFQVITLKVLSVRFPEHIHKVQVTQNHGHFNISDYKTTVQVPEVIDPKQPKFVLNIESESVPENPCPLKVHNCYWQLLVVLMHIFGSTTCRHDFFEGASTVKESDYINCMYGSILRLYNLFTELSKMLHDVKEKNKMIE